VARCPSWNICGTTLHNVVLTGYDASWNRLSPLIKDYPYGVDMSAIYPYSVDDTTTRSALRFGGWNTNTTSPVCNYWNHECAFDTHAHCPVGTTTSAPCDQFYCGMNIPVAIADKSLVDWYVCGSGAACTDYSQSDNGIWSLVCSGTYACDPIMTNNDTYIVVLPTSLRGTPNSNLTWAVNNGL